MAKKNAAQAKSSKSDNSKSDNSKSDNSKSGNSKSEHWTDQPAEHDYPAAASYLGLICASTEVRRLVAALKAAPLEHYKAKDLLRASRLALLPADNPEVARDLDKVKKGTALSPVLLVRGEAGRDVALTIADGYHRVCASYQIDEDTDIPCHLVDLTAPRSRNTTRSRSSRGPSTVH